MDDHVLVSDVVGVPVLEGWTLVRSSSFSAYSVLFHSGCLLPRLSWEWAWRPGLALSSSSVNPHFSY